MHQSERGLFIPKPIYIKVYTDDYSTLHRYMFINTVVYINNVLL